MSARFGNHIVASSLPCFDIYERVRKESLPWEWARRKCKDGDSDRHNSISFKFIPSDAKLLWLENVIFNSRVSDPLP